MKKNITALVLSVALSTQLLAQPRSLAECRRLALQYNEQMQMADNAVRQAELDRKIAFAQYLPKIDGSFTTILMKDQDIIGMSLQARGTYMAGLNITEPLYVGGRITAANRLAAIGEKVSEEQRRKTEMQLIASVDHAYYQLVAVRSKVQMLEAYARQIQSLYDKVQLSVNAELATNNDLLRITAKQSEIAYQLQKARNGEQLCQLALANIIGTDFEASITPTDTLPSAPQPSAPAASLPSSSASLSSVPAAAQSSVPYVALSTQLDEDFSSRPDLQLLNWQVKAKQAALKATRANYLPTVAIVGRLSYYDNLKLKGAIRNLDGTPITISHTFSDFIPIAMLNVSVPLFHWGAELKKVKKAKIDVENARLQLQQGERGMHVEVRQAVQNLTDSEQMVRTATLSQQQADENLRMMRLRYDTQMATMTDLLDAQSQWQQAHSNLIEAQTQQRIYETEYLRVTGKLTVQ